MPDTALPTATAEPAQVAQTPVEKSSNGSSNTSQSDFAKKLAAKQTAPSIFQAPPTIEPKPAEKKTEEPTKEAPVPEVDGKETETEAAKATDPAEATDPETDEVLSPEQHSLDPKLQEILNKRIGKEVAKRHKLKAEMQEKMAALEAKIAQAIPAEKEEVIIHAPANVPLAEIGTLTQLEQLKANARSEIRWAEQYLEDDIPAEGIQTDRGLATKKQLLEIRRNARAVQEDLIPQRETFLKARQASAQTALEKFPFLKDPAHPGYQLAQQAKRDPANAWLQGLPNSDYVLGVQIKGILAMQAEEAAAKSGNGKAAAKVVIKPKPTGGQAEVASDSSTTRAPIGAMDRIALETARSAATKGKKSLGHKDFARLLAANQQFRNS